MKMGATVNITCKIIANSSQEKIIFLEEEKIYKIYMRVPPVDGKANKKLIELLSNYFSVPAYKIRIISGLTTTIKIVSIGEIINVV